MPYYLIEVCYFNTLSFGMCVGAYRSFLFVLYVLFLFLLSRIPR